MKKHHYLFKIFAAFSLIAASSAVSNAQNPFGEVYSLPTGEADTDEYFAATGVAYGRVEQMGELQIVALTNAQNIVRQKMKHAYKGMVRTYANTVGDDSGTKIFTYMEHGGEQVIDAIVNDTNATGAPKFSAVDNKGNVYCYIGVRVSKKEAIDKIARYMSENEELKNHFREEQFRNSMDRTFREYRENN